MDGHDWSHDQFDGADHLDHPGHDPLELSGVEDPALLHDHGLLDDWVSEHGHDPGPPEDHSEPDYGDHGELPADEVALDPEPHSTQETYPPVLEVSVSPADGQPWVDPALLGTAEIPDLGPEPPALFAAPEDLLDSLHQADGSGTAADWDALSGSDDPAVRSLAELWRPESV